MSDQLARLHSQDSEQAVIGALLIDPNCATELNGLRPEHFYDQAHRLIVGTILSMLAAGKPVDVLTVAESLAASGHEEQTGGLAYLGEVAANTTGRNVGRYAEIVIGKALERQLLAASDTIREIVSGNGGTREKLMSSQSAVMRIAEAVATKQPKPIREILMSAADVITQRYEGKVVGLPTGYDDLDEMLSGGLRPGNVIIVAGRPAMGKTAFAVNIAYSVARRGRPVFVVSMEMSEQELADRLIAQAGVVPLSDVIRGCMEGDSGDRIMAAVSNLSDLPIHVDDQGGLTLFELASKARSVKARNPDLALIVVDYLQLMQGDGDNRNAQIEGISRGVKALAKELDVPIVMLSQLNRGCEARPNKRPYCSDLRESGSIEQDADVIMFVYRDEIYNSDSPDKGTAEIILGKNRQGSAGLVRLAFQGEYTRFVPLAHGWRPTESEQSKPSRRRGASEF